MRDWLRSWWVLLTVIPFGWFAWSAFVYTGLRARRRRWVAYGAAYLAAAAFGTAFIDEDEYGRFSDVGGIALFGSWLMAFIHGLVIRREYLDRRDVLDNPALREARRKQLERQVASELSRKDAALAELVGVGRPAVAGAFHGGLVDVNNASVEELARLPAFDEQLARKVVLVRDEVGQFGSVNELAMLADLPAPVADAIRDHVVFLG